MITGAGEVVREFRNPNRARAALAVAIYGAALAVLLGVLIAALATVIAAALVAVIVAVVAVVAAWRNARSGLFVTPYDVVARNLGSGWRVPLGDVSEISLMSTATDPSRRTHVWVISTDGGCHQVTCLHGNPLRGEVLLTEIRGAVDEARGRRGRPH